MDATGEIKVTLWEDNIRLVKKGTIYKLTNTRVRFWNCMKLTATPTSVISETTDEKLEEIVIPVEGDFKSI